MRRALLALAACLLASTALAQAPSPASMGITSGMPQILQYLDKNKNWVPVGALNDVRQFGAKCDNATDDTTAINAALAAVKAVYIPPGLPCRISGTLNIASSNTVLSGAGIGASTITSTSASLPAVKIAAGLDFVTVQGLTINRTVPATAGGDGIDFSGGAVNARIEAVFTTGHWYGIDLGGVAYGQVIGVISAGNYSDGVHMTNLVGNAAGQWLMLNTLSELNDGWGYNVISTPGAGSMPLEPWIASGAYANTLGGARFQGGAGTPIGAVRICGGDFSTNGNDNIRMDFVLNANIACGTLIELAGQGATGRGAATPKSNVGNGVWAGGSVSELSIGNALINGNSQHGVFSTAFNTQVTGATVNESGTAAPGTYDGIHIQNNGTGSVAQVSGTISGDPNPAIHIQANGVSIANGVNATVTGNNLCINTNAPLQIGSNSTSATVSGNACAIYTQTGTGNIAGGQTSTVITHGLTIPPNQVIVGMNSSPGATYVGMWADTYTATTFTAHLTASVAAGVNFSWQARVFNN